MQNDSTSLGLTNESQKYLTAGVVVLLPIFLWFFVKWIELKARRVIEWLMASPPQLEALQIFEGFDGFAFKAASFTEKSILRKTRIQTFHDYEIEIFFINSQRPEEYLFLSLREPTAEVSAQYDQEVQIRFKYKKGRYWTGWSKVTSKTVPRAPFLLEGSQGQQANPAQPDNAQEPDEKTKFTQLYDDLKNQINSSEATVRFMGRIGAGKSTLINTILCAFTKQWREKKTSYGGHESVTRKVNKEELVQDRIWLADMPGFQKNSSFKIIKKVIEGLFDGMSLKIDESDEVNYAPNLDSMLESSFKQKTAVVLVFDNEDVNGEEDVIYKNIIIELAKHDFPCIGVVTKVDKLRGKGEKPIDESNFYTDKRVVDCCLKLQRKYGVNTVIPIMNYSGNTGLNHKINYISLKILAQAINKAR